MWSVEVQDRWVLFHDMPGSWLVPFRRDFCDPVPFDEVLFLSNCIAFDHDMPTFVQPTVHAPTSDPPIVPLVPSPGRADETLYYQSLGTALSQAVDIRLGLHGLVMRYDEDDAPLLTRFEERFADRSEVLGLYAMATRQVDVLSEYLCLYRVLEAPGHDDGKPFVASHLSQLETYDFGSLAASEFPGSSVDVFDIYRRRALDRLAGLRRTLPADTGVAEHLYKRRNSLAHGKSKVLVEDFGDAVASVAAEVPIVKLLARMAVEGHRSTSSTAP